MPEVVVTTLSQQFFLVASSPSLVRRHPVLLLSDMTKQLKDLYVHSKVPGNLTVRGDSGVFRVPVCDLCRSKHY